jgi:hypothetical protein
LTVDEKISAFKKSIESINNSKKLTEITAAAEVLISHSLQKSDNEIDAAQGLVSLSSNIEAPKSRIVSKINKGMIRNAKLAIDTCKQLLRKEKKANRKLSSGIHYFSVDPGRNFILTVIEFKLNSKGRIKILRKFRLSKQHYYTITGAFKFQSQMKNICQTQQIQQACEYIRLNPLSLDMSDDQMNEWFEAKDILFDNIATNEHSKLEAERQRKKQKAIDRYIFNQFTISHDGQRIDPNNVVVFYGASKFAATGKFEEYGASPTVSILKAVQRHFKTILVDEFNTTRKCSICEEDLIQIERKRSKTPKTQQSDGDLDESQRNYVRDYRYCNNCVCNIDRDYNACLNIAKAAVGWRCKAETKITGRAEYLRNESVHHHLHRL